jgi:hypothetical protein
MNVLYSEKLPDLYTSSNDVRLVKCRILQRGAYFLWVWYGILLVKPVQNSQPLKWKTRLQDNIKLHLTETGCEDGSGWNWLRIVSSCRLWY